MYNYLSDDIKKEHNNNIPIMTENKIEYLNKKKKKEINDKLDNK